MYFFCFQQPKNLRQNKEILTLTSFFICFFKTTVSAAIGYPIVGDPTYSLYGEAAMFGGLDKLQSLIILEDNHHSKTTKAVPMERCSMDIMKGWTTLYPPNIKPMCLHAAFLKLQHPVTGEICQWDVRPVFL
jgi:23S rRNA-/tRNA-specific pseudouridylate synthase